MQTMPCLRGIIANPAPGLFWTQHELFDWLALVMLIILPLILTISFQKRKARSLAARWRQ